MSEQKPYVDALREWRDLSYRRGYIYVPFYVERVIGWDAFAAAYKAAGFRVGLRHPENNSTWGYFSLWGECPTFERINAVRGHNFYCWDIDEAGVMQFYLSVPGQPSYNKSGYPKRFQRPPDPLPPPAAPAPLSWWKRIFGSAQP